jgi:hypothetical protein
MGLFCCVAWWRPALMERPICVQLREGRGWLTGIGLVFLGEGSVCQRLKGRRESLKWKENVVAG